MKRQYEQSRSYRDQYPNQESDNHQQKQNSESRWRLILTNSVFPKCVVGNHCYATSVDLCTPGNLEPQPHYFGCTSCSIKFGYLDQSQQKAANGTIVK